MYYTKGFLGDSVGKNLAANAGDVGSTPRSRRSPAEDNGNTLQYSCLENSMDSGAWRSLAGYNSWGCNRVGHDLATK